VVPATDEDWAAEYLSMDLAVAVVPSLDAAVEHIRRWSSGHTEAICTSDLRAADAFVARVDSAVVAVNASTAFTDGAEFGLGAESRQPLAPESLDLVVAYDVLEHIPDDAAAAKGVFEPLRPGGTFLVAVPCDMRLWAAHDVAVDHVRRYEREELLGLLTGAG